MELRPGEKIWNPTENFRFLTVMNPEHVRPSPATVEVFLDLQARMLERIISEATPGEVELAQMIVSDHLPELTTLVEQIKRFPKDFVNQQLDQTDVMMNWRREARELLGQPTVKPEEAREHAEYHNLETYLSNVLNR